MGSVSTLGMDQEWVTLGQLPERERKNAHLLKVTALLASLLLHERYLQTADVSRLEHPLAG